jgi:hypothetical protein
MLIHHIHQWAAAHFIVGKDITATRFNQSEHGIKIKRAKRLDQEV